MSITVGQYNILRASINKVHLHVNLARECYRGFLARTENSEIAEQARECASKFSAAIARAKAALLPFEPIEIHLERLIEDSRNLFSEIALARAMAGQAKEAWAKADAVQNRLAEAYGVESELAWAMRQAEEIYLFAIQMQPFRETEA